MLARILTGVIGAAVILLLLALRQPWPLIPIAVAWVAALWELGRLRNTDADSITLIGAIHLTLLWVANLGFLAAYPYIADHLDHVLVGFYGLLLVFQLVFADMVLTAWHRGKVERLQNTLWHSLLFITLPLYLLYVESSFGPVMVLMVLGLAWAGDTGSMLSGKLLGRLHISPKVSPHKTLEGAIGGWAATLVFLLAAKCFAGMAFGRPCNMFLLNGLPSVLATIGVTALLATWFTLVGFAGDVTFSAFKRACGVKNYSALVPGHGGVLDRIDGLLFIIPSYFLCITLFSDALFI
jgi:CDP-diglyceride synthetase